MGTKGKREKEKKTFQVAIRVPASWVKDADIAANKLSKAGQPSTRTDALRMAMSAGLQMILSDLKYRYGNREPKVMYTVDELLDDLEKDPPVLSLGGWHFREETHELVYFDESGREMYAVDLDRMKSSAPTLDMVMQLAPKVWLSSSELGLFVRMLDLTMDPQGTMCSFGHDSKVDPKKILTANGYLAKPAKRRAKKAKLQLVKPPNKR